MRPAMLPVVLVLGGCWSWSFPEELLQPDGPDQSHVDARVDAPDVRSDLLLDRSLEAAVDLAVDASPCSTPCSGMTPVCDTTTGACRTCREHTECIDGLCALDGRCPAVSKVGYVKQSGNCPGSGTKTDPHCSLKDANDGSYAYLWVEGTISEDVTLDTAKEYHGVPGATLQPGACDKLVVDKVAVGLHGFTIMGNVKVQGGAWATLSHNTIGPSTCIGVTAAGASVTLLRNLIAGHTGGGVFVDGDYSIQNNIIVKNGATDLPWGGVKLKPANVTTSVFINNTVSRNTAKASNDKEAGGVRCETPNTPLVNSILWDNTASASGQLSLNCKPTYCDLEVTGIAPSTCIADDPTFVGGSDEFSASYYHVQSGSKVQNKGTPVGAPSVDFDNQPRSDGIPDIGADEL